MCGFFGFYLTSPLTDEDLAQARLSLAQLAHRGPDGQGEWFDRGRGIYLGHRRLSIIDTTEASSQPMTIGTHTIAYNGELYNYEETRSELASQGEVCRTTGDTEVLLRAWKRWGEGALDKFDGMFAFAIDDGSSLTLVTDPFGEKPLYLANTARGIYFASEPAPLLQLADLRPKLSERDVAEFLSLGFLRPPHTGIEGLECLLPGSVMTIASGRPVHRRQYWQPRRERSDAKFHALTPALVDRVSEVLTESLARRLRSDVPVGLFLSAGVDSTLVGALAAKELGIKLQATTVSFPDGVDEAPQAAAIARHLGLDHEVVDSRTTPEWQEAPRLLLSLYGTPNDNYTAASIRLMSSLARPRFKVALSGLGGDELFYGYNKYAFFRKYDRAFRLGSRLPRLLLGLDPILSGSRHWTAAKRYFWGNAARQFTSVKNAGLITLLDTLPGMNALLDDLFPAAWKGVPLLEAARMFDLTQTMPTSYIPAVDRGSMRAGLEVRTPFLSRKLFDLTNEISSDVFFTHGLKSILNEALRRYLPPELLVRKKQGFVFPLSRFLSHRNGKPTVQGVPASFVETIWQRRLEPGFSALAFRLTILEACLTGAMSKN